MNDDKSSAFSNIRDSLKTHAVILFILLAVLVMLVILISKIEKIEETEGHNPVSLSPSEATKGVDDN